MGAGWGLPDALGIFRRLQDTGEQRMSSAGRNTGADPNGIKQNLIKLKTEKKEPAQQAAEAGLQNCREPGGGRADSEQRRGASGERSAPPEAGGASDTQGALWRRGPVSRKRQPHQAQQREQRGPSRSHPTALFPLSSEPCLACLTLDLTPSILSALLMHLPHEDRTCLVSPP